MTETIALAVALAFTWDAFRLAYRRERMVLDAVAFLAKTFGPSPEDREIAERHAWVSFCVSLAGMGVSWMVYIALLGSS